MAELTVEDRKALEAKRARMNMMVLAPGGTEEDKSWALLQMFLITDLLGDEL